MPKRKRGEDEASASASDDSLDQAVKVKRSRLKATIEQGQKILTSALKLARGFERQKLGRRQKTASAKDRTVRMELLRLREEVLVLRGLDLSDVASKYLFKQMVKTKRIRESAAFVGLYGDMPRVEGVKQGAEANLIGRLFKSNPVRECLPGIMADVYGVLEIKTEGVKGAVQGKGAGVAIDEKRTRPVKNEGSIGVSSGDEMDLNDDNASLQEAEDDASEFSGFDEQVASLSSDEASLDEEMLPNSNGHQHNNESVATRSKPRLSYSLSPSPEPTKPRANKIVTTSTAFIPSLMMGGYYSGSESASDLDDGLGAKPERKNRRGQRARQKIAEAKFGAKAKHLHNQQVQGSRDKGWDGKRGATDGHEKRGRSQGRRNGRGPMTSGANEDPVGPRAAAPAKGSAKTESSGPLHPSWEAARKKKEQNQQMGFQGKKITFQ